MIANILELKCDDKKLDKIASKAAMMNLQEYQKLISAIWQKIESSLNNTENE